MPYIGNTVQNQGFSPAVDYYNGDGTTVTFTLSRPVASVAQLTAVIENVIQNPSTAFSVAGNQITFTSAPPAGTNNIWVEYTSLVTTYAAISQDPSVIGDITATGGYLAEGDFGNSFIDGTIVDYVTGTSRITTGPSDNMTFYHGGTASRSAMMDLYHAGGAKIYGTTALTIPVGTTAERPGAPAVGMQRYNTTLGYIEYYNGVTWYQLQPAPYTIEYLVVAGGGSGGGMTTGGSFHGAGGGGGAGGYISGSTTVEPTTAYSLVIGAGGAGASASVGANGANSTGFSQTAVGGGYGGRGNSGVVGGSGGSGGGGTREANAGGSGTSGQGNAGATYPGGSGGGGGGGGGAGASGSGGGNSGGPGGAGLNWQSLGTFYAGGGGGAEGGNILGGAGAGGAGGGGTGAVNSTNGLTGGNATANTGGGGGGGGSAQNSGSATAGGNGGSGIVIIRYAGGQKGLGGTVTSSGGYTYHTFTTSGTYTG
jgi:hypothetical protein